MGRLGKMKREIIEESNKRILGEESTIEYEDDQWLVVDKEEDKEDLDETTEAEETEEEGVGAPVNDMVEEQDEFGEGPLGIDPGIDVGSPQAGDGEGGLGEAPDSQVFAEDTTGGSFAKYNITLED